MNQNRETKQRKKGTFVLSILIGCIQCLSLLGILAAFFISQLAKTQVVPKTAPFSGVLPVLFFSGLAILCILIILLLQIRSIRHFFFSEGWIFLMSAVFSAAFGFLFRVFLRLLSGEWQEYLIRTVQTFREFSVFYAGILLIIAAFFLMLHACIKAVKGGQPNENI